MVGRHESGRERGVVGEPVRQPEPHVEQPVWALGRQFDPELPDQAPPRRGPDLGTHAGEVALDALVTPHGKRARRVVEDRGRPVRVVKVRVDHRDDRAFGDGPEFGDRGRHLLAAFFRVDGDDSVGALDECLVREAVAHQAPDALGHRPEAARQALGVIDQ